MTVNTTKKAEAAIREMRRSKVSANLLGGLTYRQMAETLDCSLGTIAADVKIILGRLRREQIDNMADHVQIQLTRLDRLLNAVWNDALEGDLAAIDRALKIMERQAKLLGLDEPEKRQTENSGTLFVAQANDFEKMDEDTLDMVVNNLLLARERDASTSMHPASVPAYQESEG